MSEENNPKLEELSQDAEQTENASNEAPRETFLDDRRGILGSASKRRPVKRSSRAD